MLRLARLTPAGIARQGVLAARYTTDSGAIHGKKEKARVLRDGVVGGGRTKSLSLSQLDSLLEGNVKRAPRRRDDFGTRSDRIDFSDRPGREAREEHRSFGQREDRPRRSDGDRSDRPFRQRDDRGYDERPMRLPEERGGFSRRGGAGSSFARGAASGAAAGFARGGDRRGRDSGAGRGAGPVADYRYGPRVGEAPRASHRRGDDWVERGTQGTSENPYTLSIKIKKFLDRHPDRLSRPQVDELVALVENARADQQTAPPWNMVLARMGRDGYYKAMWKAFNKMKKRGTAASSRTFTVMLNAYAGIAHSGINSEHFTPVHQPEPLTMDRVRRIYDLSQSHIRSCMARAARDEGSRDDLGIAYPEGTDGESPPKPSDEISVFATNAYLKFLGRYGLWNEMEGVFLAMDREGPLSPDLGTYYTMLNTANNIDHYRRSSGEGKAELAEFDAGAVGRGYWDQAVRRLHGEIDNGLALAALACFAAGSPADQRVAEELIPRLWGLSAPGLPATASAQAATYKSLPRAWTENLPVLGLDMRTATALLSTLRRMGNKSLVAHYTRLLADDPNLKRDADLAFLRVLVHNLAFSGDADAAAALMESYQPPTGPDGWPTDVYLGVINAARWASDWDIALSTFRRMVALPPGVESGNQEGKYKWKSPNGRKEDSRGKRWIEPRPHTVNTATMGLMFKTALAAHRHQGIKPVRAAADIYEWYGPSTFFHIRTAVGVVNMNAGEAKHWDLARRDWAAIAEAVDLARDVEIVAERLIELPRQPEDKDKHEAMRRDAQQVIRIWAKHVEAKTGGDRKFRARFLRSLD